MINRGLFGLCVARVEHVPSGIQSVAHENHLLQASLLCKTCNVFTAVFSKLIKAEEVETFLVSERIVHHPDYISGCWN